MSPITINPIGVISTPFKQKFGIPRQPGLASQAKGEIHITSPFSDSNAFRGLEQFSHIWLIFHFHKHANRDWTPLVRPPRLGGNEKIGVFASRSTFRPNFLGQSVVKLESISFKNGNIIVTVAGVDLLDQTPIIDIKPYIPYADSIPEADAGYATKTPNNDCITVFSDAAAQQLVRLSKRYPDFKVLINQILSQDPRPAYKTGSGSKTHRMQLYNYDIHWSHKNGQNIVEHIVTIEANDGD